MKSVRIPSWYHALTANMDWFAYTVQSQTITVLLIPLLIGQINPAHRASLLGLFRLAAILLAVLAQSLTNTLLTSARTPLFQSKMIFLLGNTLQIVLFSGLGYLSQQDFTLPLGGLLVWYALTIFTSTAAHSALQSDPLNPAAGKPPALFSAFKVLLELPFPLLFMAFILGNQLATGKISAALAVLGVVIAICTTLTLRSLPSTPPAEPAPVIWQPFVRSSGMLLVTAAVILAGGFLLQATPIQNPQIFLGAACLAILGACGLSAWIVLRGRGTGLHLPSASLNWWIANRLIFLAASTNVVTFLVYDLQENFYPLAPGKAVANASWVVLVMGVFILLTALPANWLIYHLGKKKLIAAAAVLAAAGMSLWITGNDFPRLLAAIGLVGCGVGLFYAASWVLGLEVIPPDQLKAMVNRLNLLAAAAGASGAYLTGLAIDRFGSSLGLAIYVSLFLLSLSALPWIRSRSATRR